MLGRNYRRVFYWASVVRRLEGEFPRECPLCGYQGRFAARGHPPRYDAVCARCRSLERHRLFYLALQSRPLGPGSSILHFAPEPVIASLLRRIGPVKTADIEPGKADLVLDIEKIGLPAESFDVAVANHVLEHVDDSLAISELFRILAPGGILIATVPLVEGWDATYENPQVVSSAARLAHFGRHNHVRWYGRDFRDRIRRAGFALTEFTASGEDCVRYGLVPGERIFFAAKPGSPNVLTADERMPSFARRSGLPEGG
jgi:SAM-dependent methyltransferase